MKKRLMLHVSINDLPRRRKTLPQINKKADNPIEKWAKDFKPALGKW